MHTLHLCDASIIYDLFTESEPMSLVVFALCDPTDVQLAWIPPFVPVSPLFCFIFGCQKRMKIVCSSHDLPDLNFNNLFTDLNAHYCY